jgi:hypothetical protein
MQVACTPIRCLNAHLLRREGRPPFEVRVVQIAGERVEVVPSPGAVEDLEIVGGHPQAPNCGEGTCSGRVFIA